MRKILTFAAILLVTMANAQKYEGIIDKIVAVVGGEYITLSELEQEVQMLRAQGMGSDRNTRCNLLENMLQAKLFLMQARLDSLTVNSEMVQAELSQRMDQMRTALGGDEKAEEYFGKPLYKLRQEWQTQLEENSLIQQEQQQIAKAIPEITPYDVKLYLDSTNVEDLPVIPIKYQMSQICIYPDRESANLACKERLLGIRERIINGDKFSTLARLYSEDPGSARKGGELGMASKSIFWPAFSDAAMSLKEGTISQIVETPDGFHIIQIIEKQGDMFNARHILLKPKYTEADQTKAFKTLDSLKTAIDSSKISFEMAARFYSQDPATRTNGGQMANPHTGSAYFEIDQIKPEDYTAVKDLQPGEISKPIASRDNEGRDGNLVYKIVRLDKIIPAHPATFENDYTELLSIVQSQRQHKAIDDFLDKKIEQTYIIIDPLFGECDFSRKGWASKIRQ
ncbi:MAG TPA: peptidylprolyl isomerase [Candidatus Cryptobacteroides sp.]|jgi:peptidyl-prolyl cis-trans isomerase SurA|nr:peptidylprolyl isomerase [Candidatus Cryptobacteroides sp.]